MHAIYSPCNSITSKKFCTKNFCHFAQDKIFLLTKISQITVLIFVDHALIKLLISIRPLAMGFIYGICSAEINRGTYE